MRESPDQLPGGASPVWIGRLGYVLALQDVEGEDRSQARLLLEALAHEVGLPGLTMRPAEALAQLRLLGGDHAGAIEIAQAGHVRADVHAAIEIDALNPAISDGGSEAAWLARLNTFTHNDQLQPIELAPQTSE
uniref:hypothetical protein n=1 Tax=Pseudactinotalea sp. TaxID=1926260 RepID=UPI003B3B1F28